MATATKTSLKKSNKLNCAYSVSFNSSNVGKFLWRWILYQSAGKEKENGCFFCSRPRQHVLSRCSSATTANKCTKKPDARAKLLFAHLNLMGFCCSRCLCLSSLGDSETWGTIFSLRMISQASWINLTIGNQPRFTSVFVFMRFWFVSRVTSL